MEQNEEIVRKAASHAEANVYSLDNPYLNFDQKGEVEYWFQLPGYCMVYTFFGVAIWSVFKPIPWTYIVGIPLLVNVFVGFINYYLFNPRLTAFLFVTIFHNWVQWLLALGTAAFLAYRGSYLLAVIAILCPLGIFSFIELHIFLYTILDRKYRMHTKYAFFKRKYGLTYPFEKDL